MNICQKRDPSETNVAFMDAYVKRLGSDEWICIAKNVHNVLTNGGRDFIHNQSYTNSSAGTIGSIYLAVSADSAAPAAGNTTLASEIASGGLTRALSDTHTHSNGTNTSTVEHTFTASATHTAVHKAALFNASSSGTLTHAAAFSSDVTLASGDQLKVTFTLTLG